MSIIIPNYAFMTVLLDDSDNALVASDALTSLFYRKVVNSPGLAIATVRDGHPLLDHVADDRIFQIYISYTAEGGITVARRDFVGLYRDSQEATDADGNVYHLLYFPGINEILTRNLVAYPAGVNNRSQWTNQQAAIIAQDIVRYNCTASGTTVDGRLRNVNPVKTINIGASAAGSPAIDYAAHGRNVLEVVKELAAIGGFDFEVNKSDYTGVGNPPVYTFFEYAGQLGSDLSGSVVFDLALDNIKTASYGGDRQSERTVAIVGGKGEGSSRTYAIRTGPNQSADNDYEVFVDARTAEAGELDAIGDAKMEEVRARYQLTIETALSYQYFYRRSYNLGDLVTAQFAGVSETKKINAVEVSFSQDQRTEIRLELIDA